MTAATYDLTIEQGATLAKVFTWKDSAGVAIDVTSYTARCQIRRRTEDTATLADLTSAGGGITLGGVAGTVQINLTAAATALLSGSGVYDVEVISAGGTVTRLVEGKVYFKPNVTR